MRARRVLAGILLAGIVVLAVSPGNGRNRALAQERQPDVAPSMPITAGAALLMEETSGRILFEKEAEKRMAPASITKIMTMLLVMEAIDQDRVKLSDMVVASERAMEMGGSQIWLEAGEEMSLEELMKAIAVVSANDASVAVAEHIAGSEGAFVDMMNRRAIELGMSATQFVNTTGLPHPDHYTTARDIALMSRALLRHPKVHEWFSIWIDYVRGGKNILVNTNRLIRSYEGVDGLKTGYTEEAGYCLAATAKKGNLRLISVVLNVGESQQRFKEAAALLDFGFRHYAGVELAKEGQVLTQAIVTRGVVDKVGVIAREPMVAVVRRGEEARVKKEMAVPNRIGAPVERGQKVGELSAFLDDGTVIARVDLVAAEGVKRGSMFRVVLRVTHGLLRALFRVGGD